MPTPPLDHPMRIHLSDERRGQLAAAVQRFVAEHFVQDARAFLQDKLGDLEGEFYEPEEPPA